ncbi:MAG: Ku protein [Chloroflexi bacterium]|nr:MAG: Ku protein [Chloroflexota bacterium]
MWQELTGPDRDIRNRLSEPDAPILGRMPRSMWRGAISFGMVAIPVRMYLATESKSVSFRLLCPNDGHPIKNRRWCPEEDKEVPWSEVKRGWEVAKDEYVVIEDSDLDRLPLPSTQTIEILEFVADSDIESGVYVKGAYYLEPESVGVKPYYLLKQALDRSGKVAIGKIALRDREHLCRLALHDHGLLLNTLHWPDEIRDTGELTLPEERVEIHERELEMAQLLIDNLTASFDPSRYHDHYREALTALVEEKLGTRPAQPREVPQPPQVMDLMAALKASLEASRPRAEAGEKTASKSSRRKDEAVAAPTRRRKAS